MAIACNACGKPVHEQVVVCPHCGEPSGVRADPIAEIEIATLPELPPPARPIDPLPFETNQSSIIDPIGRAVTSGVAKVVGAAFDLIGDDDEEDEPLPRAIALDKRRSETKPDKPPAQPKILK